MTYKSYHVFNAEINKFINLDSKFISQEYLDQNFRVYEKKMLHTPSRDILTLSAYNYFFSFGLREKLMTFYQQANNSKIESAHIDYISITEKHFYSLNVLIYGQGKMNWYNTNTKGKIFRHPRSPKTILYENFDDIISLGDPIDIWEFGKVALVRTDIPHLAVNNDAEERLALSIRWDKHFDWDGAIEFVQKFIDQT